MKGKFILVVSLKKDFSTFHEGLIIKPPYAFQK